MAALRPLMIVHSRAPLRVNDIGGWTDTWFAREGRVLNLAVDPPVEVQVKILPNPERTRRRVVVHAANFSEVFRFDPDRPVSEPHALLQFTLAAIPFPDRYRLVVRIHSPVPAGISTGTSASVAVALLGALNRAVGGRLTPLRIAALAHRVETRKLGLQSGIQDQICAARGGLSDIRVTRYPRSRIVGVPLRADVRAELDRRLMLVYLGRPHRSSAMHEQVIAALEAGGRAARPLERLKGLAGLARQALLAGDLEGYGRIMSENNECQRALFSGLVAPEADEVIRLARKRKAAGWKVNGAGGQGGSLTLLAPADDGLRCRLAEEIPKLGRGIRLLPASLSAAGLAAWRAS
jgi:D-glycero-alpha-D-manno-heptose-7-phosphate kinase